MIITTDTPTNPKEAAQLHPFIQAHKPHGFASYQLLDVKARRQERRLAHDAGEWKHPAIGEDDKAMDVIIHQHQTHRSWHGDYCILSDKHLYTR